MPTFRAADDAPVVQFDQALEISPFELFRRLRAGSAPRLIDIRRTPETIGGEAKTLQGAERADGPDWTPEAADEEVVLLDDHGNQAAELARRLQAAGYTRARALFGGLDLYEFSLDPEIVGSDTFLVSGQGPTEG